MVDPMFERPEECPASLPKLRLDLSNAGAQLLEADPSLLNLMEMVLLALPTTLLMLLRARALLQRRTSSGTSTTPPWPRDLDDPNLR
jgi:hypothetical protein